MGYFPPLHYERGHPQKGGGEKKRKGAVTCPSFKSANDWRQRKKRNLLKYSQLVAEERGRKRRKKRGEKKEDGRNWFELSCLTLSTFILPILHQEVIGYATRDRREKKRGKKRKRGAVLSMKRATWGAPASGPGGQYHQDLLHKKRRRRKELSTTTSMRTLLLLKEVTGGGRPSSAGTAQGRKKKKKRGEKGMEKEGKH